jgi:hypothetical protein
VLSPLEHRLDPDRPNPSLVHRRAGVGPPTVGIPRAESHREYQARYIGEVRRRDARSPEAVVEIHHPAGRALV